VCISHCCFLLQVFNVGFWKCFIGSYVDRSAC
jgi:hypothetical protein